MKVFGCQFEIAWEDKAKNFARIRALLDRHRLPAGSLVVLPEMFATGFSMNTRAIAEAFGGPTTEFLRDLARQKGVYVLGSLALRGARDRIFNEMICMAPSNRCVARYAKLHLFAPGGEAQHYSPGSALGLFRWGDLKVSVHICYDLRFPETFRMAVQCGAGVLVVIANWPKRRHAHWTALLRARAVENQAYVVGVNRCGRDPQLDYAGGSVVIDPHGEVVASAGASPTVLCAELLPAIVSNWRQEFSALKDVRTHFALQGPN